MCGNLLQDHSKGELQFINNLNCVNTEIEHMLIS